MTESDLMKRIFDRPKERNGDKICHVRTVYTGEEFIAVALTEHDYIPIRGNGRTGEEALLNLEKEVSLFFTVVH